MKQFILLTQFLLVFSAFAQNAIEYPYNPDFDADGFVQSNDLLDLLGAYNNAFTPTEILIDNVGLTQVIQDLQTQLQDMQTALNQALTSITPISSNLYTNGGGTIGEWTNRQPYLGIHYMICVNGLYPSSGSGSEPFLGQIVTTAQPYFESGTFMYCEGQLLSISSNTALFSVLGTTYGGNGMTNFALPDLRGRVLVGSGTGPGLSNVAVGQKAGAE